jgi:hypothetical protein
LSIYFAALNRGETVVSLAKWIYREGDCDDEMGARNFDGGDFCGAADGWGAAKFFKPGGIDCAK